MNEDQKKILSEIEAIAFKMDQTWMTICGKDIGADGMIGFLPVVGDFGTSCISLWIAMRIYYAFDRKLKRKWCALLLNIYIDFCLGTIPLMGDIFDVYWKANIKNINILRKHYGMELLLEQDPDKDRRRGKRTKSTNRGVPVEAIDDDSTPPPHVDEKV